MPITGINAERTYRELFSSKETSAITLLAACLDEFGQEGFELEPEALAADIAETFRTPLPQVNFDKIMSAWMSLTTDLVHNDISTFIGAANAFNGTAISFDVFDPADPYECAWLITELTLLDPETPVRLGSDVKRYIGEMIKFSGLVKVPPVLRGVADFGEDPYFELSEINVNNLEEAAVWQANQEANSQAIEDYVKDRLIKLISELNELPTTERSDTWVDFAKELVDTL
tara:strand:+ start:687 stop:1376 length:690 start_codon:yes stop_codon:yes gene_type:complete